MRQGTFFDKEGARAGADAERVVLYALGEFQARGKVLAERDLPLDRLRGAFRRAAEVFGADELGDEATVAALDSFLRKRRRRSETDSRRQRTVCALVIKKLFARQQGVC